MPLRLAILGIALTGCGNGDTAEPSTSDTDTDTTDTEDTDASPTETITADGIAATCTPQADNVLRYDCEVTLDTAGSVSIDFSESAGDVRTRSSDAASATTHQVTLWGMRAGTEHNWTVIVDGATGPSGTFTTAALPAELDDLDVVVSGNDPVADHVIFATSCGTSNYTLVVGSDGEVYWYQHNGNAGTVMNMTDEGTVLVSGNTVAEFDMAGNPLLELTGFSKPVHHDAYKYDGHVYVLFAESYPVGNEDAVLDGIFIYNEGGTLVETWELFDHVTVTEADLAGASDGFWDQEFPGALDYSHGNSVFVDDSGFYLSTRWMSTVWKMKGLNDPDFGDIDWSLTGERTSPIDEDLRLSSAIGGDDDFIGQHHATISADGTLTLFDNREQPGVSRGIGVDIDAAAGTAEIISSYELPLQCNIQGGTFRLDNGDTLVTCATEGTTYHFRDGAASDSFSMDVSCGNVGGGGGGGGGGRPTTARMEPIDL